MQHGVTTCKGGWWVVHWDVPVNENTWNYDGVFQVPKQRAMNRHFRTAHKIFLRFGGIGMYLYNAWYQLRDVWGMSSGDTKFATDAGELYQFDLHLFVFGNPVYPPPKKCAYTLTCLSWLMEPWGIDKFKVRSCAVVIHRANGVTFFSRKIVDRRRACYVQGSKQIQTKKHPVTHNSQTQAKNRSKTNKWK